MDSNVWIQLQVFYLAGITDLLNFLGDTPLTAGALIVGIMFAAMVAQTVTKILKVYNRIEADLLFLKNVVDPKKIGDIFARLAKNEDDLNNIARKSRDSDRLLLQHINSHCHHINHISSFLQAKMDYHSPTKMNLPDDMI